MMRLYKSGRHVDPMKLRAKDLDIHDIAHNLSMICRFSGSFPFHYSVAQHSLLVCQAMRADNQCQEACLAGLLHDAAEYLFNDLISSVKHDPKLAGYRQLEHQASRMILANYGVSPAWLTVVKAYDTEIYLREELTRSGVDSGIAPMQPYQTFQLFLDTFHKLAQPAVFLPPSSSLSSYENTSR